MGALAALYRNPETATSKKSRPSSSLKLAAQLARQVGMVPTWPNLQTIRLALEAEVLHSGVSLGKAAEVILKAAKHFTRIENPHCPLWARGQIMRENTVDRFWFEDARWRMKEPYAEILEIVAQRGAE